MARGEVVPEGLWGDVVIEACMEVGDDELRVL
jgi:hypothetical protein